MANAPVGFNQIESRPRVLGNDVKLYFAQPLYAEGNWNVPIPLFFNWNNDDKIDMILL